MDGDKVQELDHLLLGLSLMDDSTNARRYSMPLSLPFSPTDEAQRVWLQRHWLAEGSPRHMRPTAAKSEDDRSVLPGTGAGGAHSNWLCIFYSTGSVLGFFFCPRAGAVPCGRLRQACPPFFPGFPKRMRTLPRWLCFLCLICTAFLCMSMFTANSSPR